LSNLYINGFKVNWIDAKNYYGVNTYIIKNNINKQSKKYINNFGSGCIIFRYGFNEKYNNNKDLQFFNL